MNLPFASNLMTRGCALVVAGMAFGDKDAAVGRHQHRIGLGEEIRGAAGHAGLAHGAQQLAAGIELQHRMALGLAAFAVSRHTVGDPEVILFVDGEAMRELQQARAERLDEIALGVELHDRIELAAHAAVGGAAVHHPDIALAVARHRAGRAHGCGPAAF